MQIAFLAIARDETPEWTAIQQTATAVGGDAILLTPDATDVNQLVNAIANRPVAVSVDGESVRWADAGWYLVPLLALCSLVSFRRTKQQVPGRNIPGPTEPTPTSLGEDSQ